MSSHLWEHWLFTGDRAFLTDTAYPLLKGAALLDGERRVVAQGRDVKTTLLAEVMTSNPVTIDPGKSFGYALLLMHHIDVVPAPAKEWSVPPFSGLART